jgi:hypothetical protein
LNFNKARACLVDALAVEMNMTSPLQRQYDINQTLAPR